MKVSGMRLAQIKDMRHINFEDLSDGKWHQLIFSDIESLNVINVREIKMNQEPKGMFRTDSALAALNDYFRQMEIDSKEISNKVCKKGCYDCCTNDFEIRMIEFFMILRLLHINFPDEVIQEVAEKARMSLTEGPCHFVDDTTGECKIYEVRPLICRKYGLYRETTDCRKLQDIIYLLKEDTDTALNTLYYKTPDEKNKRAVVFPQTLVYWFSAVENGKIRVEKYQKLYEASSSQSLADFVKTIIL